MIEITSSRVAATTLSLLRLLGSLLLDPSTTMPPKGFRRKGTAHNSDDSPTPPVPSLAEQFSYMNEPRPFKNPDYVKTPNRRAKTLKILLAQERERDRLDRERRRQEKEDNMDVDGEPSNATLEEDIPTYASIEAPPSVLPQRRYCDITGLEGPYTDPATGLRYHDKSIYELIKGLSATAANEYLSARGVNPVVK
ncbi:Chromatin-remodeling complex subunit ies6 [Sparassis crispa]|uniref:Chromatin-remodeling complex subunit ies6 n=1 Tax=Sparassis crispa TaxID=139825 RepID=A0A401GQN7_9APHY|nr:Chromatin-remodeling complex subunit ies6 [Sparassis crispa]GBE84536.1 Chromatin-remodeling complex subunit ies6 [Sparassis crispa]